MTGEVFRAWSGITTTSPSYVSTRIKEVITSIET